MDRRIKMVQERVVYSSPENPWVTLFFDEVEFPDGGRGRYNRIVERAGVDGVAVLPVRCGSVGLARQYRYPVGCELWEIPRGFGEANDPRCDAVRELEEEIGARIHPDALTPLGYVYPNSGLLQSKVILFAADCSEVALNESATDGEVSQFRWVCSEDAFEMAVSGEITDAISLAALLRSRGLGLI